MATYFDQAFCATDSKNAEISKKKLIASGANITIVSSLTHLDPNTTPIYHRADKPSRTVQTANNSTMAIQGQGKFEGVNGVLCESASYSLLSTSQYTREKDAVVIMSSAEAVGVKIDSTVTSHLNAQGLRRIYCWNYILLIWE